MTAQADPSVRVYYRIIDDPKFEGVYDNDANLACWLRLLLVADGTWPAPAPIPASVRRSAFRHLVDAGLVDLVPGGRYRIHGMDSERGERREKARAAANKRYSHGSASAEQAQSDSTAARNRLADDTNMHSAPLRSTPLLVPPTPAKRGLRMNGTNPRAIEAQEGQRRRDIASALQQRYLRGELDEDQLRDARRQAGLS
jgi:hypothetical protein